MILRFLATSQAFSFRMLSKINSLAKSLLSDYAALWGKHALSDSFLYKCFELPASLSFWILSRSWVNGPQAL